MVSSVVVGDLVYRVVVLRPGDAKPEDWSADHEGMTDCKAGKLYVSEYHDNPARQQSVFFHELVHAALEASGTVRALHALAEAQGRDEDAVEEDFVASFSPALLGALRSAGLVRL